MKKIISVVGARPNFMKIAPIYKEFLKYSDSIQHLIVHTGQHYDYNMSDKFFSDLELPRPNYFLGVGSASHAVQTAKIMVEFEKILIIENPDLIIVAGDVNSTIACSFTSVKMGIKTAHLESGLRSFDRSMPEEINRIATDAICNYAFVTEASGMQNLLNENFDKNNIFLVGNTMIDNLLHYLDKSETSEYYQKYEKESYVVVTLHRPSNVDNLNILKDLVDVIIEISNSKKVIFPLHPRTKNSLENFGLFDLLMNENIIIEEPLGYIDFIALVRDSYCIITDSGGIQEETTQLKIPCLTVRENTERPVTIEIGSNFLVKPDFDSILNAFIELKNKNKENYQIPELWDGFAATRICKIINDLI